MTRGRVAAICALVLAAIAVPSAAGDSAQTQTLIAYDTGTATAGPYDWVANANGSHARRLGPGLQPLISPSGGYVASGLNASKGPALVLYSTSGAGPQSFFNAATVSAEPVAWSPDSRYVAVELSSTQIKARQDGLAVIDTKTMRATTISSGKMISGASFNPSASGGDRLVYGTFSLTRDAPSNLYTVGPTGANPRQLTYDNHSLLPVWGAKGIVYVRETPRGSQYAPVYQLWLRSGSTTTELTHLKVGQLVSGLAPLSISSDGNRILAEFGGQDTSYAWTVQISPRRVMPVDAGGNKFVQGGAISGDGTRLLVDVGAFQDPPSRGTVESVAFGGGKPTRLARGADPTWNG